MYTVKEVAEKMSISTHTLRFYENQGFFPYVIRDKNNVRQFSTDDLNWVQIVQALRTTGMPLVEVKRYIELCQKGDITIHERFSMILAQCQKTQEDIEKLNQQMSILKSKATYYQELVLHNQVDNRNPEI
ncbi:MerR family transcriptional regulator [Isobaculum melis]|uniref:DNA-binding transcriptional regulator, MerR family n=1 Tax=Isobaculum melis TaxID=142588 RepID=A0A1H9R639_9LACT|nr:MerR family transcriptional regulator [Isobaculum melis]SER68192.1 DNA-binding transcriptional regulator, MerR family [Isobaculum melis]